MGDHETTANKIKQLRLDLGLSVKAFAKLIGISRAAIFYWESGKRIPELSSLRKIQKKCNKTIEELLGEE